MIKQQFADASVWPAPISCGRRRVCSTYEWRSRCPEVRGAVPHAGYHRQLCGAHSGGQAGVGHQRPHKDGVPGHHRRGPHDACIPQVCTPAAPAINHPHQPDRPWLRPARNVPEQRGNASSRSYPLKHTQTNVWESQNICSDYTSDTACQSQTRSIMVVRAMSGCFVTRRPSGEVNQRWTQARTMINRNFTPDCNKT